MKFLQRLRELHELTALRAQYDELANRYRSLRDVKTPLAPDDGPWQARFVELDREFDLYRREHADTIRENRESKVNFREAKIHFKKFLEYMERE